MPEARDTPISSVEAVPYRIPTDGPEGDGTFDWNFTTLIVVHVRAGNQAGLGYTYGDACIAPLVRRLCAERVAGRNPFDICGVRLSLARAVRNSGRPGVAACAMSAIDAALWDLKGKLLGVALATLLGRCRDSAPIYGSGGFTTYSDDRLTTQLSDWAMRDKCRCVKMKIGRDPERDPKRAMVAKSAIGDCELFVDANGAFSAKQALRFIDASRDADIRWFEEPVTSDDPKGLRLVRESAPDGVDIAAGEYIYNLDDARRLLETGAVDVLQADVTRCGGISGFLEIGALCEAYHTDLSGHCAPSLHRHVACAVPRLRHLEWFHDHVRIEQMLFDGAPRPVAGAICPDLSRPGHGLEFKAQEAEQFQVGDDG
jgi:L-alanine-DL-glutamate epimerase-like enolase superfamily enzyme